MKFLLAILLFIVLYSNFFIMESSETGCCLQWWRKMNSKRANRRQRVISQGPRRNQNLSINEDTLKNQDPSRSQVGNTGNGTSSSSSIVVTAPKSSRNQEVLSLEQGLLNFDHIQSPTGLPSLEDHHK